MSYSKKKYIKAVVFLVSVLVFYLLFFSASLYYTLLNSSKYIISLSFFLGFLYYPLCNKMADWVDSRIGPKIELNIDNAKNAKRGFEGENLVCSWLKEIIGKENFLKNVKLPNNNVDFDFIVVNDKGVVLLEVKNYSNNVHFENDEYYFVNEKNQRFLLSKSEDPRYKIKKYSDSLKNYLYDNGFKSMSIKKAIIFSNGKVSYNGKIGTFIIDSKKSFDSYMSGLKIDFACTIQVQEDIKKLLKHSEA